MLRDPAHCVIAVVNVAVGPVVGAVAFSLENLNLCQKVKTNPDKMRGDYRHNIKTWKKSLFLRQRETTSVSLLKSRTAMCVIQI